jgi:osmoprotectant transport system ATP-binding protein
VRKTILFVTHDVQEALKLGDQIVVLSEGRLIQQGTAIDLLASPANDFVRRLLGADSVLRQFEYLPVTMALEPVANGAHARIPAEATLLQALLGLIQKGEQAVLVEEQGQVRGQVSVSSIFRTAQSKSQEIGSDGRAVDSATAR